MKRFDVVALIDNGMDYDDHSVHFVNLNEVDNPRQFADALAWHFKTHACGSDGAYLAGFVSGEFEDEPEGPMDSIRVGAAADNVEWFAERFRPWKAQIMEHFDSWAPFPMSDPHAVAERTGDIEKIRVAFKDLDETEGEA